LLPISCVCVANTYNKNKRKKKKKEKKLEGRGGGGGGGGGHAGIKKPTLVLFSYGVWLYLSRYMHSQNIRHRCLENSVFIQECLVRGVLRVQLWLLGLLFLWNYNFTPMCCTYAEIYSFKRGLKCLCFLFFSKTILTRESWAVYSPDMKPCDF